MNIEELGYLTQRPQRKTVVKGKRQTLISRIDTKVKCEKKKQEAKRLPIVICQLKRLWQMN